MFSSTGITLFLTAVHPVFCTAIPNTFRRCENCLFGKSVSEKLSFGLSRFCWLPAVELEKEGRMCSLGFFPLNTSHSTSSCLSKHTLKYVEEECFLEMRFPSVSSFVFPLDVWSTGKKKWCFGYKPKCMCVSSGQDRLHNGSSARLVIIIGRGHVGGRTAICHILCHFLGVNRVLSALIKHTEEKAWPRSTPVFSVCLECVHMGLPTYRSPYVFPFHLVVSLFMQSFVSRGQFASPGHIWCNVWRYSWL